MRVLLIDAGNTRVRAALAEDDRQRAGAAPPGQAMPLVRVGERPTVEGLRGGAGWIAGLAAAQAAEAVVLASVVPAWDEALAAAVPNLVRIDGSRPLPFALDVAEPMAVGPDRLCNVAAAAAAGLGRALVIDVGTATTFDLLLDGVFVGGLIAPGPAFAAACLGERAARLAPVPFGPAPLAPGRDTAAAMAGGAWHVGMGGIRHTAAALAAACGPLPVVVTGGLGAHLADLGAYDADWTLRGALVLAGI